MADQRRNLDSPRRRPRRKLYSFWIDPEHLDALKAIQARDGILPSEQIRRALAAWIERKGLRKAKPAGGRRPSSRRRGSSRS